MDNITIIDNIYNIAYLKIIDISKTPIHIPQGLPQVSLKNLDKITDKQVLYLSMLYPPMALPPNDISYELSGRSWLSIAGESSYNQNSFSRFKR